jgi:hypothetical protein
MVGWDGGGMGCMLVACEGPDEDMVKGPTKTLALGHYGGGAKQGQRWSAA